MIYELYWSWYEDYQPHLFEHEQIKTEEEFEADCKKALLDCVEEYLAQEDSWAGMPDWIEYACKSLTKYGYERVRPVSCGWFGGYIIKADRIDSELQAEFPAAYKLFAEHNSRIEKEMYKDMGIEKGKRKTGAR